MEAASLKKKNLIKKGKLKKTIKNILCRSDPVFWPQTTEDEEKILFETLNTLKVDIPHFKKPVWSELSQIPKELRPKPPPIPKVEGLIFGITECQKEIDNEKCVGVLIESAVNPRTIVHPLIEMCSEKSVPVLCLKDLRCITKINFGIPTSVLGVKQHYLTELEKKIIEISKLHRPPNHQNVVNISKEICTSIDQTEIMEAENESTCPYLYRTDKTYRVFTPSIIKVSDNISENFVGQNFIKLSNSLQNENRDSRKFMKMIVKRMSSNPNRIQKPKY